MSSYLFSPLVSGKKAVRCKIRGVFSSGNGIIWSNPLRIIVHGLFLLFFEGTFEVVSKVFYILFDSSNSDLEVNQASQDKEKQT